MSLAFVRITPINGRAKWLKTRQGDKFKKLGHRIDPVVKPMKEETLPYPGTKRDWEGKLVSCMIDPCEESEKFLANLRS